VRTSKFQCFEKGRILFFQSDPSEFAYVVRSGEISIVLSSPDGRARVTKYQKRISDPMLDRIDIHIEAPRVDYEKLRADRLGESSESIRARVQVARDRQRARFSKSESKHPIFGNADMRVGEIRQFCKL
jgi:predicted ATPase with chaperone activity